MTELTQAEMRLMDAAQDRPARCVDAATGATIVVLRLDDFAWIQKLLGDEPDAPARLDPRSAQKYVLLPLERYERFKAFFEEDPLSPAEKEHLLRRAGVRAGWNAPVWENNESTERR